MKRNNGSIIGRLEARAVAAESKANTARLDARAAKVAFKKARKDYKQLKRAAKETREQAESVAKELEAAQKRAAKLKSKAPKPSVKLARTKPRRQTGLEAKKLKGKKTPQPQRGGALVSARRGVFGDQRRSEIAMISKPANEPSM
jgi:chromosome segregation ATPase